MLKRGMEGICNGAVFCCVLLGFVRAVVLGCVRTGMLRRLMTLVLIKTEGARCMLTKEHHNFIET